MFAHQLIQLCTGSWACAHFYVILCFKIHSHLLKLFKWMYRCCFAVKLQKCFVYYENSPEFPSGWVWAHNDKIHIFGWIVAIRKRDRLNFSGLWTMKEKLEKKQYLFLHQGITIGHWFQPLNEHPSKNKLKPSCLLSQFSEVIIKRNLVKKLQTQERVHSHSTNEFSVSKHNIFWLDSTLIFGSWSIWSWCEVFVSRARPLRKFFFATQISQYVKLQWVYCTTTNTCSYMCTGTEQYKYLGSTSQDLKLIKKLHHTFPDSAKP